MTMPWIALVCDISGVCRVVGTFEITSKPTKTASTKIVISVIRLIAPHLWISRSLRRPLSADLALVGDARGVDDVVLEVDLQRSLLVDEQPEQVLEVLRVELRGVGGHVADQIARPDHLDPVDVDRLP